MDKKEKTCNRCGSKDIERVEGPFDIHMDLKTVRVGGTLYKCRNPECGSILPEGELMTSLLDM